jgi:putative hydrolase of the HAD superfamily
MGRQLRLALFDLDNTIYPASSGVMRMVDSRIGEFVQQQLGLAPEAAAEIRRRYFIQYGTTLRGLQTHHSVDSESYLRYVHEIALESYLASDAELDQLLEELPLRKAIFTNAPGEHAERVLRLLGIERHFEAIFDIRFCEFLAKPELCSYERVLQALQVPAAECVMIEDTLSNLAPARQLGMLTILISEAGVVRGRRRNGRPLPADYAVPDVLAAIRLASRLAQSERAAVSGS